MYLFQGFCNGCFFFAIVIVTFAIVIELFGFLDWERLEAQTPNQKIHSLLPPSYRSDHDVALQRLPAAVFIHPSTVSTPDTTAIILNWSRLPNVVRIVNVLCDKSLENTIATVLVWNNSPRELTETVYCFHLIFIHEN
jgi:hypothetical protein